MAFCGNCGYEVPEGMKFCPNCGTAVFELDNTNTPLEEGPDIIDVPFENRRPAKRRKVKAKRSVTWMIVAIVSLILGIVAWVIPSDVATWIIMTIALAAAIVSLCMKAKFKAIPIISIVISGVLVLLWIIQGIIDLSNPRDPKEAGYRQGAQSVISNILSIGGVDPQLKAALDEYEAFADEYVLFMKKYKDNPYNALGMLADYSNMLSRLAEFSEKINGYDVTKMSTVDYEYYMEVLERVNKKLLDAEL